MHNLVAQPVKNKKIKIMGWDFLSSTQPINWSTTWYAHSIVPTDQVKIDQLVRPAHCLTLIYGLIDSV